MKISAISDVHIKKSGDQASMLFLKFLDHEFVKDSNYIMLLGDIFDLMCGPHNEYLQEHHLVFSSLKRLMSDGKKVYFFEGNHDLHLEKLFKKSFQNLPYEIIYGREEKFIESKKYLFSHGDEYDFQNKSYLWYRNFIQSPPLKFFAEYILPYKVLTFIGEKASSKSRKKGSKIFDEEMVRQKFRAGVEHLESGKGYHFILGGHSHVQDCYQLQVEGDGLYLNNGYALRSKTFIAIENHQHRFENLI
jgi:UDP-2,3-diacylglucosamine hydrolase